MALNGDDRNGGVRTPLLAGVSSTLPTSGSGSVVLPSSTVLEPPNQRRSRWWSIRVMYLTMFMSAVTFTLTMSTIWPFLQVVDVSATPSFLGWVVAGYSLGQVIASPLFGTWSARQSARPPLLCSLLLQVGSNLFYAYVQSIPANGGVCLIAARIVMGFAAGNAAVVRAYVSAATTVDERTGAMSKVSLFQSIGFILGPIIQTALVYVGFPGPVERSWLHFNMYTSPAILAAFFTIVNFVLVLVFFRLHTVSDSTVINTTLHPEEDGEEERIIGDGEEERIIGEGEEMQDGQKGPPDYKAVALSVYLFFITFFVFTIFETIGTALTMDMYGWTKEEASKYIGYTLGGAGCVAIVVFLIVANLAKKGKDERIMLLVGFVMCLVGFFTFVSWGHDLPALSFAPVHVPTTHRSADIVPQGTMHPASDLPWQDGRRTTAEPWAGRTVVPYQTVNNSDTTTNDSTLMSTTMFNATAINNTITNSISATMFTNVTAAFSQWTTPVSNVSSSATESILTSRGHTGHTTLASSLVSHFTTVLGNWTTESATTSAHSSKTTTAHSSKTTSAHSSKTTSAHSNKTTTAHSSKTTSAHSRKTTSAHSSKTTSAYSSKTTSAHSSKTTSAHSSKTTSAHSSKTTTVAPEGCPWYFAWCESVPKIQLWQFLLGTFFISIGYPMCNAMTYSIYSKVLGDKPQGMWMGVITSSGSLARMLGPIFVAQIYDSYGPRVTFSCTCVVLALTLVINVVGWRRLVPYDVSPYRKSVPGRKSGRSAENRRNGVGSTHGSLQ